MTTPEFESLLQGQRVFNGPRKFRENVWNPLVERVTDSDDTRDAEWPRCDDCTLPAVCVGAQLARPPENLCGQCCPTHCGNDASVWHRVAEGVSL